MGLLRRVGAESGTPPTQGLRRPLPLPPEQQGTEKSHHFFGLCGGSACGAGGRAERALSRESHLSRNWPGWELWQKGHSEAEVPERRVAKVWKGWHRWMGYGAAPPSARAFGKG